MMRLFLPLAMAAIATTKVHAAEPATPAEPVMLCRLKDPTAVIPIYSVDTSKQPLDESEEGNESFYQKGVVTSDHVYPCSDYNGARIVFNKRKAAVVYYDNKASEEFPREHYADLPRAYEDDDQVINYGTSPVRAYFDYRVRSKIQVNDKIGVNFRNRDEKGAEFVDLIEVNDGKEIYIIDSAFVPEYEDPLETKGGRIFYHVDVRDPNNKRTRRGWVDSGAISLNSLPPPPKDYCPPGGTTGTLKELRGDLLPAEARQRDNIKQFLSRFSCLSKKETSFSDYSKKFRESVAGSKNGAPEPVKSMSMDELHAIDALARTMYGEMRGCHYERGPEYSMAVGKVALNRAERVRSTGKGKGFPSPQLRGKNLSQVMVSVLGQQRQFSSWNAGDPNRSAMLCVKGSREQQVWKEAIEIATEVIRNPEGFKERTKDIPGDVFHYSSNVVPWWSKNMRALFGMNVDGNSLRDARCFIAWSASRK